MCTLEVKERCLLSKNSRDGTTKAMEGFRLFNFLLELFTKFFSNVIKSELSNVYIFSKKEELEVVI